LEFIFAEEGLFEISENKNLSKISSYTVSNPAVKKSVRPQKGHCKKRCKIQGGGQEIAVMVG